MSTSKKTASKKVPFMSKKAVPEKAEPKKPEPKKATLVQIKYVAILKDQFHPFQRVRIPTGAPGVILEKDSWLECQLDAGIVKEI